MGKHSKGEDMNAKPYDPNATPEQKAEEFKEQWAQNGGHPTPIVERQKGRHRK